MNKLRQSFRRKKDVYVPESSRPHQWQTDEEAVRSGKCSFTVKAGKKAVRAVLWVSADGLRVVDDKTKDLILDQTIEKVSFCAPDRNFERAFSYICRDGTTRRWICHCFMAIKDSAIPRRHAPADALARQGSFRGFPGLSQSSSPFKRQVSLRIGNELPAAQRRAEFPLKHT
ncbi:hypothetical protein CRUP_004607, partial [Coryphaenoides rupestris]